MMIGGGHGIENLCLNHGVIQRPGQRIQATCRAQFALAPIVSRSTRCGIEYFHGTLNVAAVVAQQHRLQPHRNGMPGLGFQRRLRGHAAPFSERRQQRHHAPNGSIIFTFRMFQKSFAAQPPQCLLLQITRDAFGARVPEGDPSFAIHGKHPGRKAFQHLLTNLGVWWWRHRNVLTDSSTS